VSYGVDWSGAPVRGQARTHRVATMLAPRATVLQGVTDKPLQFDAVPPPYGHSTMKWGARGLAWTQQ
jgi:hypothetical protein